MKNYLKTNWKRILISCLMTVSPVLVGIFLWDRLPDMVITHWGADGVADGTSSKAFAVFFLPLILLGLNLLCLVATAFDKKNQNKNARRCILDYAGNFLVGQQCNVRSRNGQKLVLCVVFAAAVWYFVYGSGQYAA